MNVDAYFEKIAGGGRLAVEEAVELYHNAELQQLGVMADKVRRHKHSDRASYVINRYLNYSNVCILSCQFCAFARRKRDPGAFELSVDEMVEAVKKSLADGITEIHIVGGLHPTLPFEYYTEMIRRLKALDTALMVKAFTAIEIRHLAARVRKATIEQTLQELREAGLDALTGGGAEIFDPAVRDQICRGKETAAQWLEVHRIWHRMGAHSTCTMLYGHVESVRQRFEHLQMLRELQDETGGFTGLVPYAFEPENNELSHIARVGAVEELRMLALCRLFMDNIPHLTAYWISMGLPLAQVALSYGVDDLHGTIVEEKIFHMAGARSPVTATAQLLEKLIREVGRRPVQRDTYYRLIGGHEEKTEEGTSVAA